MSNNELTYSLNLNTDEALKGIKELEKNLCNIEEVTNKIVYNLREAEAIQKRLNDKDK